MVQFYVCRINLGKMKLDDVLEKWRDAVRDRLEGV